jgi:outer membrane protein assembly factor BamB
VSNKTYSLYFMLIIRTKVTIFIFVLFLFSCSVDNTLQKKESSLVTDYDEKIFLRKIWRDKVDIQDSYKISFLTPAITDDKTIVATRNGMIYAFDKNNFLLWKKKFNLQIATGISYNDEQFAIGGFDGEVLLWDSNGKIVWQNRVNSSINAQPLFMLDKLIVKGTDNTIVAFDLSDGSVLWEQKFNLPSLSLHGQSKLLFISSYIIAGLDDGTVVVLKAEDGSVLLQKQLHSTTGQNIITRLNDINSDMLLINEDIVIASYQGIITRISLRDFTTKWQLKLSTFNNFIFDGVNIFIFDENDVLIAVSATTGKIAWQNDSLKFRQLSHPAILDDNLLVSDHLGFIHLLDSKNGQTISQAQYGTVPISGQLATKENKIYFQTINGEYQNFIVEKSPQRSFIHFK